MLLMLVAVVCFSLLDTLSKYMARFYPVNEVVWVRYTVHAVLMLAFCAPKMGWRLFAAARPGFQILRATCLLGTSLLFTTSLRFLPLAEATAIIFVAPMLVIALSAPLLGEKVSRRVWVAGAVGFCGVLLIVRPGAGLFGAKALLPLGAALFNSLYMLVTRKMNGTDDPLTTHFLTGLIGSMATGLTLPLAWAAPHGEAHLLLFLALGCAALSGHFLLIKAYSHASPAALAPFMYLQLIWSTLFGVLVFHAMPDMVSFVGMAVIMGSGLYIAVNQGGRTAAAQPIAD